MPETITENGVTYNCSSQGLTMNFFENNYFTKVVFPNCYKETTMSIFQDCSSIKEISYEYESDDFCISMDSFKNCTSLKNLYMYAESITVDDFNAENAFFNVPTTAVAHVKNNTVKKSLEELMWPGSIIVDPSLGGGDTVNYTSLDTAIANGEAVDTTKYTEDSVKALTDAIAAAKAVKENAAATQDDVDAAAKAVTDAIAALEEVPVEIKWTGSFDRASGLTTTDITGMTVKKGSGYMTFSGVDLSGMADPYVEVAFDANGSDDTLYVATSAWKSVIGSSTDALATASLADFKSTTSFIITTNNKSGSFGKITSVRFYDAANDAPIDYTALDAAIADGEAVDTTKYTEDSAKALTDAIASAKAVKENAAATQDDVDAAAKAIEDAVSALEIVWPITYDISAKHDGSVKAAVYIDGSLLISGSGATADYTGGGTNITPLANHEITSVKVEEGITDLGDWLFYDCTAITSITFPSTLKSIGAGCFSHTGFTSIEIPDSVTSVGRNAFSGCSSLVTVKLSSGLTTLNEDTFYFCKSLTSVNIPDGVTSIGRGVFSFCTGLTSIDLPSGLTSIEGFAFNGCGLTGDVVVPSGVVALESQVFMNCTSSDLKIHLLGVIESYHNIGYASNPFEGVTGTIYVYNQASYDLLKKYVPATATLVFSNAYTDLETAINEADSKKEADYTSDSWEAFLTALANAKAVLAGGSSDFTAAKTDLTKAIEALVFADTSEIKESLAELVEKIELLLTLKDESGP